MGITPRPPQGPPWQLPDRGMVEVWLVVASQTVVDHLQVLGVGRPQVQAREGGHAPIQRPHHGVGRVLQPGTAGPVQPPNSPGAALYPPRGPWSHGGPAGWRTRRGGSNLLLIRYSAFCCFSPEATTDLCSCRTHGGCVLLLMGTLTPSRGRAQGESWWVCTSWLPRCPSGLREAVTAVETVQ